MSKIYTPRKFGYPQGSHIHVKLGIPPRIWGSPPEEVRHDIIRDDVTQLHAVDNCMLSCSKYTLRIALYIESKPALELGAVEITIQDATLTQLLSP